MTPRAIAVLIFAGVLLCSSFVIGFVWHLKARREREQGRRHVADKYPPTHWGAM